MVHSLQIAGGLYRMNIRIGLFLVLVFPDTFGIPPTWFLIVFLVLLFSLSLLLLFLIFSFPFLLFCGGLSYPVLLVLFSRHVPLFLVLSSVSLSVFLGTLSPIADLSAMFPVVRPPSLSLCVPSHPLFDVVWHHVLSNFLGSIPPVPPLFL